MRRNELIYIIIVILFAISIKLADLMGPNNLEIEKQIIIKSGSTARQIAEELYRQEIIKSRVLFNLIINFKGLENSLKAGAYNIKPEYNLLDVIDLLASGRVATFRVTIPEGYTVEEIARRLAVLTSYSEEEFLRYARVNPGKDYLKDDENIIYPLEGFLYPDTYIIPTEYKPEEILRVMLSVFESRWLERIRTALDPAGEKEADLEVNREVVSGYSIHEIITIASLIEKEAKLDEEKPLVAAVIYNRLRMNMYLQIDACIQYILGERKERILYSDLRIDSPYNTYLYPGLPPGPIANPGAASIKAALNPADVDYLFYFALSDGSHVFTRSYSEHLRLQNEMRR